MGGGYLILIIFLFLPSLFISAQVPLFSPKALSQVSLTSEALSRYNKLSEPGANKEVYVGNLFDIKNGDIFDTLQFTLPGYSDVLLAEANLIEDHPIDGFTWSAMLLNTNGSMSITWRGDEVFGYVQADSRFFRILPVNDTIQILAEENGTAIDYDSTGTTQNSPIPPGPEPDCSFPTTLDPNNNCEAIIYVLVVVTPKAKEWILDKSGFISVSAFVAAGTNSANQAFANSRMPNKKIVTKVVERDYAECIQGDDIYEDRAGMFVCLIPDREEIQYDIAFVLTNEEYDTPVLSFIGPDFDFSYSIIEAPFFNQSFAFAHELGHLIGGRHNWPINFWGDDSNPTCAHAYCWVQPPQEVAPNQFYEVPLFTSLLGAQPSTLFPFSLSTPNGTPYFGVITSNTRLLHYSNPSVSVASGPTGRVWANNAALMKTTACQVANFYQNNHFTLDVLQSSCSKLPMTLTAKIGIPDQGVPGAGPYSIEWRYNGSLIGTGLTLLISTHYDCSYYWISCKVTSSDSLTLTVLHKVELVRLNCNCIGTHPGSGDAGKGLTDSHEIEENISLELSSSVRIFPSPLTGTLLRVQSLQLSYLSAAAEICDIQGKVLQSNMLAFDANGESTIRINRLPDGFYWMKIKTQSGKSTVVKFIINHYGN